MKFKFHFFDIGLMVFIFKESIWFYLVKYVINCYFFSKKLYIDSSFMWFSNFYVPADYSGENVFSGLSFLFFNDFESNIYILMAINF